ncbi:MAG: chemotaxis protein CheD [Clostridia bacterium]|jgi:chemotaxis protein CheD|nr:chemotaxis protein CheD [Clostridia bacterium]
MDVIKVGMADLAVCKAPQKLMTAGLGSCVGVCIYDPRTKVGGLAHIMLPNSDQVKVVHNKAKYADTGIELLLEKMQELGAIKNRMQAKIAGGAQMFGNSTMMRIGERNTEEVIKILQTLKIPVLANETGGNFGRTIIFNPDNGELYIKTINHGEKVV